MLAGINDSELPDIAAMACNDSLMVRFIEVMPIGLGKKYAGDLCRRIDETDLPGLWQAGAVPDGIRRLRASCILQISRIKKWQIGFISPLSEALRPGCNKIRHTAGGRLKPCLQYGDGYDLRQIMRKGCTDDDIAALYRRQSCPNRCATILKKKPAGEEKDL